MQETKCIGGLSNHKWGKQYHQQDRVYSIGTLALALTASIPEGSYKYMQIKVIGKMNHIIDHTFESANRVYGTDGISPTIPTCAGGNLQPKIIEVNEMKNIVLNLEDWVWEIDGILYLIRIRKLTPKECFRLMGFTDEQFKKAESVNSNTQLYKQAGNSIVVDVLESIFLELFWDEWMEDEE